MAGVDIKSWIRRRRRPLVALTIVGGLMTGAVVERDRFAAAAIASASCDDCSTPRKARVAAVAFANPQAIVLLPTVVGGRRTTSREFPAVGAILLDGRLSCTGTVIGARTILTAAHCVQGIDARRLSFKLGLATSLAQPLPLTAADGDLP